MDAIYEIRFRGLSDWGVGLLMFHAGSITGSDTGGVLYDGSYLVKGDILKANITMKVPPGAQLVQGISAKAQAYEVEFEANIPLSAFKDRSPVLIQMPPGPVNVIFRELRTL